MKTILIAVLSLCAGCSSSSENPSEGGSTPPQHKNVDDHVYQVGEPASEADFTALLYTTTECVVPPYFAPAPGNVKFGLDFSIVASGTVPVSVNEYYARLTDVGSGTDYLPTFGGCDPELSSTKLQPGEVAAGWITFEVPETAYDFMLVYAPFSPSGKVLYYVHRGP